MTEYGSSIWASAGIAGNPNTIEVKSEEEGGMRVISGTAAGPTETMTFSDDAVIDVAPLGDELGARSGVVDPPTVMVWANMKGEREMTQSKAIKYHIYTFLL
jgi:hypothetical protein